jgi:hypothetical protein
MELMTDLKSTAVRPLHVRPSAGFGHAVKRNRMG